MSPSVAMKISSPADRKIFLGSPGLLAKPKNFKLMGGGGGGGGGTTGPGWSSAGFLFTASIGSDPAIKMFLAVPAYLICSVWRNKSRSRVGSRRGSETFTNFPDAVRRSAGLPAPPEDAWELAVVAGVADGQSARPTMTRATTPSTASAM